MDMRVSSNINIIPRTPFPAKNDKRHLNKDIFPQAGAEVNSLTKMNILLKIASRHILYSFDLKSRKVHLDVIVFPLAVHLIMNGILMHIHVCIHFIKVELVFIETYL